MKWTLESATAYIKSARTRGLKFISACDYLKNNHGIEILKEQQENKSKREVRKQSKPKRKPQEGERRSRFPQHTLNGKFDIMKEEK
jgi:hypothetical protein